MMNFARAGSENGVPTAGEKAGGEKKAQGKNEKRTTSGRRKVDKRDTF